MRCHDFLPDDSPQTTLQAGETFDSSSQSRLKLPKHITNGSESYYSILLSTYLVVGEQTCFSGVT